MILKSIFSYNGAGYALHLAILGGITSPSYSTTLQHRSPS